MPDNRQSAATESPPRPSCPRAVSSSGLTSGKQTCRHEPRGVFARHCVQPSITETYAITLFNRSLAEQCRGVAGQGPAGPDLTPGLPTYGHSDLNIFINPRDDFEVVVPSPIALVSVVLCLSWWEMLSQTPEFVPSYAKMPRFAPRTVADSSHQRITGQAHYPLPLFTGRVYFTSIQWWVIEKVL